MKLLKTRHALERAWRLQSDQFGRSKQRDGQPFVDYLPGLLDAIHRVTRKLTDEAGKSSPDFNDWWNTPGRANRETIAFHRNAQVKADAHAYRLSVAPSGAGMSASAIIGEGRSRHTVPAVTPLKSPLGTTHRWIFQNDEAHRGQHWDGQPIMERLSDHLRHLEHEVIPQAELLLSLAALPRH